MAVQLEFINILVPFSAIERVHQGGAEGFRKEYEDHPGVWWDRFLFRCGSMNSIDLILWLEELEKHGLSRFRTYAGKRIAGDIALATIEFGIEGNCSWLSIDRAQGIAWLSGTEPGEIASPAIPFRHQPA
ncbi:MAG TPA: hypothetical protein PLP29_19500 [Candidatus Ozemobacteraceae bacterium]|nr:hypothetical protein [Candidatus Ozemobacteraceae bacterium]